MAFESTITGIDELIAKFQQLENSPQPLVTSAAKKGANMALKFAQANLQPVSGAFKGRQGKGPGGTYAGGNLKNVLALKAENSPKGKKVYKISTTWYASYKDLGFTTRNGKRIEGSHFLRYSVSQHYEEIKQAIIDDLNAGIDKMVGGAGK